MSASEQKQTKVFISYTSHDQELANKLCRALESEGLRVWIAPRDIPAGSDYSTAIDQALRQCTHFVVLISEHSMRSKYVKSELTNAFDNDAVILPYFIEQIEPVPGFAFYLKAQQWIYGYNSVDKGIATLVNAIKSKTPPLPHRDQVKAQPSDTTSRPEIPRTQTQPANAVPPELPQKPAVGYFDSGTRDRAKARNNPAKGSSNKKRVLLFILGGIILLGVIIAIAASGSHSNYIPNTHEDTPTVTIPEEEVSMDTDKAIAERTFLESVEENKAACPQYIDTGLTMTDVTYDGSCLTFHYRVDESIYNIDDARANSAVMKEEMLSAMGTTDLGEHPEWSDYAHMINNDISIRWLYEGDLTGDTFSITSAPSEFRRYLNL